MSAELRGGSRNARKGRYLFGMASSVWPGKTIILFNGLFCPIARSSLLAAHKNTDYPLTCVNRELFFQVPVNSMNRAG